MSNCNDKKCKVTDTCNKIQKTIILCHSPYCNYATHIYCAGLSNIRNKQDIEETYFVCNKCKDFLSYSGQFTQNKIDEKLTLIKDNISVIENKLCGLQNLLNSTIQEINDKITNLERESNAKHLLLSEKLDSSLTSLTNKNVLLENKSIELETKIINIEKNLCEIAPKLDLDKNEISSKISILEKKINELGNKTTVNTEVYEGSTVVNPKKDETAIRTKNPQLKFQIRISGVKEADEGTNYIERQTYEINFVKKILKHMKKEFPITDCFRLGKYKAGQSKPRSLLVTFSSVWDRNLVLQNANSLSTFEHTVFLSPALSPEEIKIEKQILKKRYDLIQSGVAKKDLKIKHLKLFIKDEQVELE